MYKIPNTYPSCLFSALDTPLTAEVANTWSGWRVDVVLIANRLTVGGEGLMSF